jgi:uncharacterized caspase-like protein
VSLLALMPAQAAEIPKRVALVVGNSRYETSVGPLRNPVNDAKSMARTLRALGFLVIEEHNVTRDQLMAALLKFRAKLPGAEVSLFYFAGHGISVGGANYLVPIKSGYSPESVDGTALKLLAETKLFNAEQAVAEMSSNNNTGCNLVILDACRSTPVARNPANRDATSPGGLVEMNPPAGSLIAFSTDAGHVASDGSGANGIYTAELIKHLATRGLTIEQVFKRTRAGVIAASGGAQMPAEYSRLVGDDVFLAGRDQAATPEEVIPKALPAPLPTRAEINKLAAKGDAESCIEGLRQHAHSHSALDATGPLSTLLDHIKEELRDAKAATPRAEQILKTCDLLLGAIPDCIPAGNPQQIALQAKAHNRRGDALLLLGKPAEALDAFNAALTLTPNDAYVFYNRGTALLRLDRKDEAKADFTKVAAPRTKQPGARKLAVKALAEMK